jgi:hypothetical protein
MHRVQSEFWAYMETILSVVQYFLTHLFACIIRKTLKLFAVSFLRFCTSNGFGCANCETHILRARQWDLRHYRSLWRIFWRFSENIPIIQREKSIWNHNNDGKYAKSLFHAKIYRIRTLTVKKKCVLASVYQICITLVMCNRITVKKAVYTDADA